MEEQFATQGSEMPSKVSPHENCVICETINASGSLFSTMDAKGSTLDGIEIFTNAETLVSEELEESSKVSMEDYLQLSGEGKDKRRCNACRADIQMEEKIKFATQGSEMPSKVSPHENCVICETINASGSLFSTMDAKGSTLDGIEIFTNAETLVSEELEESSKVSMEDYLQLSGEGKDMRRCNACRADIQREEKIKVCEYGLCARKFYHLKCLTTKQLKSYGPHWYCPSCLCQVCVTDCDDEKIVLCDVCYQAYHIYCLEPPCTKIPSGEWLCPRCDEEREIIRQTLMALGLGKELEEQNFSHHGRLGRKAKKQ